jgi:hypothetical protein
MGIATYRHRVVSAVVGFCLAAALASVLAGAARAAIPDRWGFAYVDKPSVPGIPVLAHQAGSWPAPFKVHVTPGGVGRVFVTFPQIATKGGVVHVTAVSPQLAPGPAWCQAQKWAPVGANEVVAVRCYRPGGAAVFVPFSITFESSSKGPIGPGRAFGYVHFEPTSGIVASFNSTGAANHVVAGPVGVWNVALPGLGSPTQSGNVQVTAVNAAAPAKCEINGWASNAAAQVFQVRCFNAGVAPLKTGWSLTYHRGRSVVGTQPKAFAYTFDNQPLLAGPYSPVPPAVNFNSLGGLNTVRTAGVGLRFVVFPRVGFLPDDVQVSAFKVGPGFCNLLSLWATPASAATVTVRDVACYTAAGVPKNQPSLVTYVSLV